MKTKVDKFGRLLIPKHIRLHLGLRSGKTVILKEKGNELIVKLEEDDMPFVEKDNLFIYTGEAVGDLDTAIEELRKERVNKLGDM